MFALEAGNVLRSQQERVWVGGGEGGAEGRRMVGFDLHNSGSVWPGLAAPGWKFSIFVAVLTLRELGDGEVT